MYRKRIKNSPLSDGHMKLMAACRRDAKKFLKDSGIPEDMHAEMIKAAEENLERILTRRDH